MIPSDTRSTERVCRLDPQLAVEASVLDGLGQVLWVDDVLVRKIRDRCEVPGTLCAGKRTRYVWRLTRGIPYPCIKKYT